MQKTFRKKRFVTICGVLLTLLTLLLLTHCKGKADENATIHDDNLIIQLADSLYQVGLIDNDSVLASQILSDLAKKSEPLPDNSYIKAEALRNIAIVYDHWNVVDKALVNYRRAEQIASRIKTTEGELLLAKIWLNTSHVYIINSDYNTAIEYALKGELTFLKQNAIPNLINAYSKVSVIHEQLGQVEETKKYHLKIYQLYSPNMSYKEQFICLNSMGCYYLKEKNQDSALYFFDKALKTTEQSKNYEFEIIAHCNIAIAYADIEGDVNKSLTELFKALNVAQRYNNPYEETDVYQRIASKYLRLHNIDSALYFVDRCLNLAQQNEIDDLYLRALEIKAEVLKEIDNYKAAYLIMEECNNLKEANRVDEMQSETLFLNAKFEAERSEYEIDLLTAQNKLKATKLAKRNIVIISMLTLLLLAAVAFYLSIKNARNKLNLSKVQNDLDAQRIVNLTRENQIIAHQSLLKGEETERSRIARNLHDGLGGLLSGIKLSLHNILSKPEVPLSTAEALSNTIQLVNQSIVDLRQIAHNMMPEVLNSAGLCQAVETFCKSITTDKHEIVFNHYGEPMRYESGFELTLYRVAQELINNALKHAKASQIQVQIIIEPQRLCLLIADNGQGFSPNETDANGSGIKGIKTRLQSYQGHIDINSAPAKGTEILIEIENPPQKATS